MKLSLANIEARLQSLVEGGVARLFPNQDTQDHLAGRLVQAMQEGIHPGPDGELIAPNLFILLANPMDAQILRANQAFLDSLVQTLHEVSQEAELRVSSQIVVRVAEDESLAPGKIQVIAQDSRDGLTPTTGFEIDRSIDSDDIPPNAFMIIDGTQILALELPVINIGRRPDNQIVINDARVSRLHAQLRAVRGRFIIFDLNSTGGTFVNGDRIQQRNLAPGDVISLAGLPLVYGQDSSRLVETQTIDPIQ